MSKVSTKKKRRVVKKKAQRSATPEPATPKPSAEEALKKEMGRLVEENQQLHKQISIAIRGLKDIANKKTGRREEYILAAYGVLSRLTQAGAKTEMQYE